MLEVDKVSTVGFEEASPGETALQLLQGKIGNSLFADGAQIGFALAAGRVEDITGIIEQDAILFARSDFEGGVLLWSGCAAGALKGIIICHTPVLQFNHARTAGAGPGRIFVGEQDSRSLGGCLFEQASN